MTTKWNGKIHPLAEAFPRLDPESFALLVESIKMNGVREPITLDPEGTLLDGINRALAAKDAGIEPPTFVEHGDPIALIRDANLMRRHLRQEQRAMIEALLLTAEGKRKDGKFVYGSVPNSSSDDNRHVWKTSVSAAGTVIDHAPELVQEVIEGDFPLVQAAKTAKKRKQEVQRRERVEKGLTVGITKAAFNPVNENIGWAGWSWNPVTGCKHDCPYCYARPISESLERQGIEGYEEGFEPAFHKRRLLAPINTTFPADDADDRERRVFVCSMADMFGRWVPQDWISQVFDAAHAAPHWEYLWLTKFPNRYKKLTFPPNSWAGTSVDTQKRVTTAMQSMEQVDAKIRWLSCEPLLERLHFDDLSMFNLVVIGAQTAIGPTHKFPAQPAIAPDFDWVMDLVAQARRDGVPVYLKENLIGDRHGQAPGMVLPQELPSV